MMPTWRKMEGDGLRWRRFCRNGGGLGGELRQPISVLYGKGWGGHRGDLYEVVDRRYLGDEAFVERVEQRVLGPESPQVVEIEWAEVREGVCKQFGISAAAVLHRGRGRENARIKRVMTWVGREVGGFTNQEMAEGLGQDPAVLSRGLGKLGAELGKDRELQRVVGKLCNGLRKGRRPKRSIRSA